MGLLETRVALITGASRGIGRALSLRFADEGAAVVCAARSGDQVKETAAAIIAAGGRATAVVCDASVEEDVRRAMHYFSVLSQSGHAGAQAFLADLYWRGKFVPKDQQRALALITVAVENAPAHERLWIEDIYQNIFCGSSQGVRKQADGVVAVWRKQLPRMDEPGSMALGARALQPQRTCGNGEVIEIDRLRAARAKEVGAFPPSEPLPQGAPSGFGLRDAGAPGVERAR